MKMKRTITSIALICTLFILTGCSEVDRYIDADKVVNDAKEIAEQEGEKLLEEAINQSIDKIQESSVVEIAGTTEQIPVEFLRMIDGDTSVINMNGQEITARYLLTDTPESVHPKMGKQPFSEEAKKRNEELLKNGQLTIEFDVGERKDKYGRYLVYIYVDGVSIQETLIKEGLARVAYVYPPNTRYLDLYEKAQEEAKKQGIGIWSLEDR